MNTTTPDETPDRLERVRRQREALDDLRQLEDALGIEDADEEAR